MEDDAVSIYEKRHLLLPNLQKEVEPLAHDSLYLVNKMMMIAYPCEYVYSSNLLKVDYAHLALFL